MIAHFIMNRQRGNKKNDAELKHYGQVMHRLISNNTFVLIIIIHCSIYLLLWRRCDKSWSQEAEMFL